MPETQMMEKPAKKAEKTESKKVDLSGPIAASVLEQLGKPSNLWQVRVHLLWDNRYRVNVWCNTVDEHSIYETRKITDSFFVVVSPEGGIMSSAPPIAKKYENTVASSGKPKPPNIADILKP